MSSDESPFRLSEIDAGGGAEVRDDRQLRIAAVVDWHRFDPSEWHIEYDNQKLAVHQVTECEAAEVVWNGFVVRPNQRKHGSNRYQLLGRTDAGRPLKLIVHVSDERSMRVIIGWQV